MNIPFCKPHITQSELDAVIACVSSGWLTMGRNVELLEKKFAEFCQAARPGIAVDSCTSALFLSMKAMGVSEGDVVAMSPITFAASANMVEALGASVKFVDIDLTGCISPSAKELDNVDYILAVDYAGNVVNIDMLREHNKPIIVDSAESHGAEYWRGKRSGHTGLIHCYSFYPTKVLAGCEGGMIIGANEEQEQMIKRWRLHGLSSGAEHRYTDRSSTLFPVVEDVGYKMNMTDVSAAIVLAQLNRYDYIFRLRDEVFQAYNSMVRELMDLGKDISVIGKLINTKSAPYIYVILVDNRDRFIKYMADNGIKCGVHFIGLHRHPYYLNKYGKQILPLADELSDKCVSLPVYPDMSALQIEYVIDSVKSYFGVRS